MNSGAGQQRQVPPGWTIETLDNLVEPSKERFDPTSGPNTRFVGLAHIEGGTGRLSGYGNSSDTVSTKTVFRQGDVLYGRLRPYLNKVCVPTFDGVCSTDVLVFPQADGLESRYLARLLQMPSFVQYATQRMSGVQHPRVGFDDLAEYAIPIPPLPEQRRIMAKLEELFTRLDAGVDALERVQALLGRYRQAVLRDAFAGRLTAAWREAHRDELEPASALLERIRREREEGGPRKRGRRRTVTPLDASELPELPVGWEWTRLEDIANVRSGVTKGRDLSGSATVSLPYLRVANVQAGYLDLSEVKYITIRESEVERYRLRRGDILFTEGGDRDKLGRGTVWEGEIEPCLHQNHIHAANPYSAGVNPYYVSAYSQTELARAYFWRSASQTVNLASVNQTALREWPVPLAPTQEQRAIMDAIGERMSVVSAVENDIDHALRQAARLRQSILRRAFEGKLVPQDPTDEPADRLLERIRAERRAQGRLL